MKRIKAVIAFLLVISFLIPFAPTSNAETSYRFEPEAWQLKRLGLYTGSSSTYFNPDLGAVLDRQLGVALLVNFFGNRKEVLSMDATEVDSILSQYDDKNLIASWARPYMAYGVKTGIIQGTSKTALSPEKPLNGLAFAAMMLRKMGYKADQMDYAQSLETLYEKGGLNSGEQDEFNKPQLIKNDAVGIAYTSLFAECPDGNSLIDDLIISGAIFKDKAVSQKLVQYTDPGSVKRLSQGSLVVERPTFEDVYYFLILDALSVGEKQVKLPAPSSVKSANQIFSIIEECVRENPETMYYAGCTYYSNGTLSLQYSKSADDIKTENTLLKNKADEILKQIIAPGMNAFQKELAIHDYIVNNCDYDIEGYNSGEIPDESYNAYGALLEGRAVCEGYAEAAKYLLDRAGVQSLIITGTSKGEGHAWNIVTIEGENYQLDVTWDDPVMADGSRVLYHHYFNLTDREMARDHRWDTYTYPACSSDKYNYYAANKLVARNQNEFVNLVVDRVQKGAVEVSVKILDFETSGFDFQSAVRAAFDRLRRGGTYGFNDIQGIADLTFQ